MKEKQKENKWEGGVLSREAQKGVSEKNLEIGGVISLTTRVLRILTFVLKKIVLCL